MECPEPHQEGAALSCWLIFSLILDVQVGDLSHELLALFAFWKLVGFGGQAFEGSHDLLFFGIVSHRFIPLSIGMVFLLMHLVAAKLESLAIWG
jgi:hypothetical protein